MVATAALTLVAAGVFDSDVSTNGVIHELEHAQDVVSRERVYATPLEALPSFDYVGHDGRVSSPSQLVVVGTFTSVTPGRGFSWDHSQLGEERRVELEYGHEEAWINTIHVAFAVEEVIGKEADVELERGSEIQVGLALSGPVDFTAVKKELAGLGRVVVFLNRSAVFDYERDLWGILEDGAFIGRVDPEERIEFLILDETDGLEGIEGLTVEDLREAS